MRRHAVSAPAPRDCAVSRLPSLDGMRAHGRPAALHYLYLRHVDHAGAQQRDADGVGGGVYRVVFAEGIGAPCMAVWALFGSSLRSLITAPRGRRVFNGTMALALATTAVMMVR